MAKRIYLFVLALFMAVVGPYSMVQLILSDIRGPIAGGLALVFGFGTLMGMVGLINEFRRWRSGGNEHS
mgnify:CR=1 FL=1